MRLYIDTSDNRTTIIKLGDRKLVKKYQSPRSQELLSVIDELLKQEKKSLKDITSIKVNPGPGSFTSLRVGVAVANALGFSLNVPVNGNKPGVPVEPRYGKPPNITQPKN